MRCGRTIIRFYINEKKKKNWSITLSSPGEKQGGGGGATVVGGVIARLRWGYKPISTMHFILSTHIFIIISPNRMLFIVNILESYNHFQEIV